LIQGFFVRRASIAGFSVLIALLGCSGEESGASATDAGLDAAPDTGAGGAGGAAGAGGSSGAGGASGGTDAGGAGGSSVDGASGAAGSGAADAAADAIDDATAEAPGCPSGVPGADSDGDGTADESDCLPCDPNVHPNVTAWQSVPRTDGSWDYDCDGLEELEYPSAGKCAQPGCVLQQGFYKVPPCGGAGEKIAWCAPNGLSCTTQYESSGSSKQRCR